MKPTGMQPSTCYATSREQEATLYFTARSHYTGPESLALKTYSDADWAGDKADRKSVGGSILEYLQADQFSGPQRSKLVWLLPHVKQSLLLYQGQQSKLSTCAASFNHCISQLTQPKFSLTARVQWLLYPVRSKLINQS